MSLYSDINSISPTEKPKSLDVESVYQALYTLLNTRKGENLFNPEYGLDLEDYLFELMDDVSSLDLLNTLTQTIEQFEPRVKVDFAQTTVTPDPDNYTFELNLVFSIVGIEDEQNFTLVGVFENR